jgi:DNA-directed RNA polymerase alpha subunit
MCSEGRGGRMINLYTRIDEVEFGRASTRLRNIFYQNKIFTIGELFSLSAKDLLKLNNFGKSSLGYVKQTFEDLGLQETFAPDEKKLSQSAQIKNNACGI